MTIQTTTTMMKAAVYSSYGAPNVVSLADVRKPSPKDDEVLIRIHATTVSTGDWRARTLEMPAGFGLMGRAVFGFFGPRQQILGTEMAGVVEAVGRSVTRFAIGDEVIAFPGGKMGAHAEYCVFPQDGLIVPKPANLSFEEAATISFGGMTALPYLRDKARIKAGEKVLVVGASGAVGAAAVQIAKHYGAVVTGVCSGTNEALVRSIGADDVIDYTSTDFTRTGDMYDVIVDTTGTAPLSRVEPILNRGGRLLGILGSFGQAMGLEKPAKGSGKVVHAGVVKQCVDDLQMLADLAESGELKPVIDRSYPLALAAEAHAYVETGRKRGSVVLAVA